MICPYCGTLIPEGTRVCPSCGKVVEHSDTGTTKVVGTTSTIGGESATTLVYTPEALSETVVLEERTEPIFGWLVVLEGEDKWKDYKIPNKDCQIVLGSGKDSDIVLRGKEIAKSHASIRLKGEKVFITDLDTETGTFVNGEPVIRKELEDGSLIKIGNVLLKFRKL